MGTDTSNHMVDAMKYMWQAASQTVNFSNDTLAAWSEEGADVHVPKKKRGLRGAIEEEVARIRNLT